MRPVLTAAKIAVGFGILGFRLPILNLRITISDLQIEAGRL
jgi:hypothetical protein